MAGLREMVLMKETAAAGLNGDVKHSEEEQCPELVEVKKQKVDHGQDEYFTSYDSVEVHRLMIRDKPRTEAYRDAILNNSQYFKDKIEIIPYSNYLQLEPILSPLNGFNLHCHSCKIRIHLRVMYIILCTYICTCVYFLAACCRHKGFTLLCTNACL